MAKADESPAIAAEYTQLRTINAAAFADGRYETAYHALMAALHCAHDLGNEQKMREVDREATDQMERLEHLQPPEQPMTPAQMQVQADARRTLLSVYASLQRQASSMVEMHRHQRRLGL